ncbi:MAG: hypothetical protein IJH39_08950 [Clostridia bacterium]|nr:hypothetical protein [Clostridia bacterium]
MIVLINEIEENNIVKFSSKYGNACGIWKDKKNPTLKKYGIEIDYDKKVEVSQIQISDEKVPQIGIVNSYIQIIGEVIDIEDVCMSIRVGDSIIELEVDNNIDLCAIYGKFINIRFPYINLYDEQIL